MDGDVFDKLVKELTQSRMCRGDAIRAFITTATALAGLGLCVPAEVIQADRNKRHHPQLPCKAAGLSCINVPKKGKKTPRSRLCKACCETFRKVNKAKGICCIPIGGSCSSTDQCCFGSCSVGLCQTSSVQLPPIPPPTPPVQVGDTWGGAPPPPCVAYGQACSSAEECCLLTDGTNIPCSGGLCRFN